MNDELETLINNLEGCIGMFDYMLTPIENKLLLSYINELQQENEKLKEKIDIAIEYIEENKIKSKYSPAECGFDIYIVLKENEINDLLEILKDSDVDEYGRI